MPPSGLEPSTLRAALAASFGLEDAALTWLPLGADSRAWTCRATAGGEAAFLKVRQGAPREAALAVPRWLREAHGLPVIAPLPARDGRLWASLGEYVLVLYPFVAGRTATEAGLLDRQWIEFGAALRQIHAAQLPPDLKALVREETFAPEWGPMVAALDGHIGERAFADPDEHALAVFWQEHRAEIRAVLAHANRLGQQVQAAEAPVVLCHADLHTWNVLVGADGRWWLVDWDEVALAPKERDLMFVIGGIGPGLVSPRQTELFLQGYGGPAADPTALAYYRCAWAVGDLGAYGEQVFLWPEVDRQTKRAAAASLRQLFAPGEIMALASASPGAAV